MALKVLHAGYTRLPRNPSHTVRFTSDELPKYKSFDSPDISMPSFGQPTAPDSGAPSPDLAGHFQPALQRYKINEQRIKLLTAINQIVQQRVELEANRVTLSNLLEELKRKLKRKIEECHIEKKDKIKTLKQANLRLEKERFGIATEIEHLRRHLEKEEAHHKQHARTAVVQAIQGVTKMAADQLYSQCLVADMPGAVSRSVARNAPSRVADNKLTAARLMRDIAELRQRVAQVETRLASEMKRKRQAEVDIIRLRKELSSTKSSVATLRLPLQPIRAPCKKFL